MAGLLVLPAGVVAVAGSRRLPPGAGSVLAGALSPLVEAGRSFVLGCCVGADVLALSCLPLVRVEVLAVFGPLGLGAGAFSAVAAVVAHARAGGAVRWFAGGSPSRPLGARLVARTRAVVAAASAGLLLFPASPSSRGSWLAARVAVGRRLPVVAVPLGFAAAALPSLGAGAWQPAGVAGAWRWVGSVGVR